MVAGSRHIAAAHSWIAQVDYNLAVRKGLAGCKGFADYKGLLAVPAVAVVDHTRYHTLNRIDFPDWGLAPD